MAVLIPHGNGLIAVFVAAITLGIRRPDLRSYFARQGESFVAIVKLGIFVVFGSLLTFHGLFADGWARGRRPTLLLAPLFAALAGTGTDTPFMAGPDQGHDDLLALILAVAAGTRIFNLAALAVFCSIILHGVTDTPGSEWIARRTARASGPANARPSPRGGPDP